jgi:pyruvate-ferredoxin/flavodoxin oxidoreductase
MYPNMFKIAGELTAAVIHVAARAVATHALSIFGDHSDVMAVRSAGWGILFANNVQEAQDMALVAQATTLRTRVPFMHAFDGFRTSHEVARIEALEADTMRALLPDHLVAAHRARALDPDHPVLRGTAQNPDVFFQGARRATRTTPRSRARSKRCSTSSPPSRAAATTPSRPTARPTRNASSC